MHTTATLLEKLGAGGFGALIGWYLFFINRYRHRDKLKLTDLSTVIGALGGAAILKIFPKQSDLFGAYGVGLFAGFFGYLLILLIMVAISKPFTVAWFLDGRRGKLGKDEEIPADDQGPATPMSV